MAPSRDVRLSGKAARKAAADTAGSKWYNLPATQITDEVKKELRLLRLRGTYDPKRFYKVGGRRVSAAFHTCRTCWSIIDTTGQSSKKKVRVLHLQRE